MSTAKQVFDFLPGIWKISRRTLTPLTKWQNSGAECINAEGYAAIFRVESDSNLLIYTEKLTIFDANGTNSGMNGMVAKQKYKYRFDPVDESLTKYFYDDRLFYTLQFDNDKTNEIASSGKHTFRVCGEHLCIEDNYVASYTFSPSGDRYTMKYSVNGPKKCYEIITDYEKCTDNVEIINNEIQ